VTDYLAQASPALADRYEALKAYLLALGDDVQLKTLKNYFAFRRLKNFACVEVHNRTGDLLVYVKVNPDEVDLDNGFTRDMRNIGHFGTGDLEIRVRSDADLERAKPLLEKSYEVS
jgi:predicted transport protein